jgi:DNA mismatch repair protein PMS2
MSTHSRNSLKENIIEIFGLASFKTLLPFEQFEPKQDLLTDFKVINQNKEDELDDDVLEEIRKKFNIFKLEGFLSSCAHNMGRGAPDRQYVYVNKRPCDNSKIVKLFNEVFHQFNRLQYPMFILNISMDGCNVDVNVTPDKLQMFIKNENYLLATLKSSLLQIYNKLFKNMNLNDSSFHSSSNEKSASLMMSFCSPKLSSTKLLTSMSESTSKLSQISDDEDEEKKAANINAIKRKTRDNLDFEKEEATSKVFMEILLKC